jgi:hypothetical protein
LERIAHFFEWKLPGALLLLLGFIEALEMMHFIGDSLGFLATPRGNLFVIMVGLLWLFLSHWAARRRELKMQKVEFAKGRLSQLADTANFLNGKAPMEHETSQQFCQVWAEQANAWGGNVSNVLSEYWPNKAKQFDSLDGYNSNDPVGHVHKDVADAYRRLLFRQRIFNLIQGDI